MTLDSVLGYDSSSGGGGGGGLGISRRNLSTGEGLGDETDCSNMPMGGWGWSGWWFDFGYAIILYEGF